MAVASSGAIDLDEFHQEAGGSANSNCTINDADIRGLIGKSDGATMAFNEWYGATSTVDYAINNYGRTGDLQIDWCDRLTIGGNANSTTFGNLTERSVYNSGTVASTTRSIFMLGFN